MIAAESGYVLVPCTQGKFAKVDSEFASYVCGFNWRAKNSKSGVWYAHTGHSPMKSMHGMVVMLRGEKIPDGFVVDHINGDGLDNRSDNLRVVTNFENVSRRKTKCGHSGVDFHKGKWRARVSKGRKRIERRFATKDEAIHCRAMLAAELHGVNV
jgi:hypothetical protein